MLAGVNEPRKALAAGMEVTPNVRLVSPLGAGGMGAVWIADHAGLNTRVVVKFMLNELDSSQSARARFKREAEAASQVKSPHVVQTFDYGVTPDGVPFIVMEHLEGRDLAREIAEHGGLPPVRVVQIVQQVARALTKAHAAGLLHRDIKPDNIFLITPDADDELFVKILDFGIAKTNAPEGQEITLDGQTKTGQVVGTPYYMSPEQVTAQKTIDQRVDIWALGVVTFEALTGKRPFDGPSFGALAVKIATGDAPKPTAVNPSLPPALDEWFAKACAREPDKRYATARELSDGLRNAFEGVLSLPPAISSGMSDSGPRDSGAGSGSRSKPEPARITPRPDDAPPPLSIDHDADERPSFVLASTAREDTEDRSSLARSEPGTVKPELTTVPPPRRTRAGLAIAVLLGTIVIAGAVGMGMGKKRAEIASTTSAATSTLMSVAPPPPSTPVSVATNDAVDAAPAVTASAVVSAAPSGVRPVIPVAPPPTRPTTTAKPPETAAPPASVRPATKDAGKNNDPLF